MSLKRIEAVQRIRESGNSRIGKEEMMRKQLAIGIGELLWDVFPEGKTLGGAPANFAYYINQLGGTGLPLTTIGNDALGREALTELVGRSVMTKCVSLDPQRPTGTVHVTVDAQGVASYGFPDDVAWDHLSLEAVSIAALKQADAVCFGTLAQRSDVSRQTLSDALAHAGDALKVYDINLRQSFYDADRIASSLDAADILKINIEEFEIIAGLFELSLDAEVGLRTLMQRHGLVLTVLTRGAEGSLVLSQESRSEVAGSFVSVVDTVGAGDAFTAATTLAYLHGRPLDEMHRYAHQVATFVCGQRGAMAKLPATLCL